MIYRIIFLFAIAVCLCACGDETSSLSSPTNGSYSSLDEKSSSSEQRVSSGSEQIASSSSEQRVSSGSEQIASSSSEQRVSSSSEQIASSSSEQRVSSSSEQIASSSSELILVTSIYDSVANTLTDLRDNQIYRTVSIGNQIWMAENLNFEYNKGSAKSYCYNDSIKYCNNYGRLYTKSAALDSAAFYSNASKNCGGENINNCTLKKNARGICPENWHIPDSTEWQELLSYVGGKPNLMSSPIWDESCIVGKDDYSFSVLPGGYKITDRYASFSNKNYVGFWFSTENVRIIAFHCYADDVLFQAAGGSYAYPIRCLKDSE